MLPTGNSKVLQAGARFGLRFVFDEVMLNPMNSPELAQWEEKFKEHYRKWLDDPAGFKADWDEQVAKIRKEFVEKRPSLKLEYAKAAPVPETPSDKAN